MKIGSIKYSLSILFISSAILASAQSSDAALEAENEFRNAAYYTAIEKYKKAFPKAKQADEKAALVYRVAECYELIADFRQAEVWYNKAIKARYKDVKIWADMGDMLKAQGKYPEAIVAYHKYKDRSSNPDADSWILQCEKAQEWKDSPTRYDVKPEKLLNSKQYDFAPAFADKKGNIIFTSSREGSTGESVDNVSGDNFSDLYFSERDRKNGKWSEPTLLNAIINTDVNEGAPAMDYKMSTLYLTRCPVESKKNMGCDIWVATKAGSDWGNIEKVPLKAERDDSSLVAHATLSKDGNIMLFTSDMAGGKGGKDLWYSVYNSKEKVWMKPTPLPGDINTPRDEMFPHLRDNGDLYFASDGHPGMGGLDIFKAISTGNNQWGEVENMKYPINSESDDFGIIFWKDEQKGFLSSNRDGSEGKDDIFYFILPPLLFSLQGVVYDNTTNRPVVNASIKVNGSDGSSFETTTSDLGGFDFSENGSDRYIKEGTTYSMIVEKEDYLIAKDQVTTIGLEESTTFVKEFFMQYTGGGVEISFPEVLYDFSKYTLRPESKDSLDFLLKVLTDNRTMIIELSAHTDSRGTTEMNQVLSENRAKACVEYLISKGIDRRRMVPVGYGEGKLLVTDALINELKTEQEREAAHQKNRRTVFSVISWDFVPPEDELQGPEPTDN